MFDHQFRILGLDGDACPDRASANPQIAEIVGRLFHATRPTLDRARVGSELLAKTNRHRVLQMRTPRFDDVVELGPLRRERRPEPVGCSHEWTELRQARETNVGRDRIVRALRHVHMIVRMHRLILAALPAEDLIRAIGQHLVDVHVV